jgi:hypothetical protein
MALDKITSTMITDEAVTTAKLGPSAVTGAKIAADAIDISDLGTIMSVGETAPAGPFIGQRWYRASTAITYQYTNDGASSFWLDVSSGGIGTSAERGIDFVGDTDPIATTNGSGLAVGSVYYNRELNRHFVCTDATNNANVWSGRFTATGGVVTAYSGYRVHTFLSSGTFVMEDTTSVDYLVVAGGAAGGDSNSNSGGGGGAGGLRYGTSFSVAAGSYSITVGAGGVRGDNQRGVNGEDSIFSTITSTGGGGGGAQSVDNGGKAGGSGGGASYSEGTGGAASPTTSPVQGYAGGSTTAGSNAAGGGGGGAGGVGEAGAQANADAAMAGNGGIGVQNAYRTGSNVYYAGGGAGEAYNTGVADGGLGGGGASATAGTANTGGGGGGGSNGGTNRSSASGGSGIVVIRYAV